MSLYETKIYGQHGIATVFTDNLDAASRGQIQTMMDSELFEGKAVRIMPDCHAGKGSVIGFTAQTGGRICANIVGVDIGCGVTLDRIKTKNHWSFEALDKAIRANVPSGFAVRKAAHPLFKNYHSAIGSAYQEIEDDLADMSRRIGIDHDRVVNSIGTLGGGNHYIEIDCSNTEDLYLSIHSGSRGFGAKVAEYHQNIAYRNHDAGALPRGTPKILAWLEYNEADAYVKDMQLAQRYATLNRTVMARVIADAMGWDLKDHVESVHNYIDFDAGYIRKGAISAQDGERLVIPISMSEGVIIGTGKGNPEWNYSAPHGAGRLLARGEAKRQLKMEVFKESMSGVWTSCVSTDTLDESPQAYKGAPFILDRIGDAVDVQQVAKPVYNFKAGGE